MNRDDVIRMAREAGFEIDCCSLEWHDRIERFAALVAAAEREACAKVCDEQKERSLLARDKSKRITDQRVYHSAAQTAAWNAAAIRARGRT